MTDKPKLRWYQFSLRTLMVLVLLSSVGFGWLGIELELARRERHTITHIESMGGEIFYVHSGSEAQSSWRTLLGFPGTVYLVRFANPSQAIDLAPLTGLKSLKTLVVRHTQVKNPSCLAKLTSLEEIDLSDTDISDLSPLAELKNLNDLSLLKTQVSDLTPLAKLGRLKWVDVMFSPVSKAEVEKLHQALPNCKIASGPPARSAGGKTTE